MGSLLTGARQHDAKALLDTARDLLEETWEASSAQLEFKEGVAVVNAELVTRRPFPASTLSPAAAAAAGFHADTLSNWKAFQQARAQGGRQQAG